MLYLFIVLAVVLAISFFAYLYSKTVKRKSKSNIHAFSINDSSAINFKSLNIFISHYFKDNLKLIVIQDDIKFKSSNFYWPKNSIYIHMSDAIALGNDQYISIMFSKSFEENMAFLKSKVYIS